MQRYAVVLTLLLLLTVFITLSWTGCPTPPIGDEGENPVHEGEAQSCTDGCDVSLRIPARMATQDGSVLIPVSVNSAEVISPNGIDIIVKYDPDFIDSDTITVQPTAITGGTSFGAGVPEAGHIRITTASSRKVTLQGEGHLFDIAAKIKTGAQQTCEDVAFDAAWLFDSEIHLIRTDFSDIGQVCRDMTGGGLGDVNGDGSVNIGDVLWSLRAAVGRSVEGRNDAEVRQAGDMNGDGVMDSADAVMLQRYLSDPRSINPPANSDDPMLLEEALTGLESVSVTVSKETGRVGETVEVVIVASTVFALSGYDFVLYYDPEVLQTVSVARGTVVSDAQQEYTDSRDEGALHISLGLEKGLETKATNAILAKIQFEILANTDDDSPTRLRIGEPKLKGQYGDDFKWYTHVDGVHGEIDITDAPVGEGGQEGILEGETTPEGEWVTEGETLGEGEQDAWSLISNPVGWSGRQSHAMLSYGGKLWILGGTGGASTLKNDVWSSEDGITWTQVTEHAQWSPRYDHAAVVFDNRMWVIGGRFSDNGGPCVNDAWYSTDGQTWTAATQAAAWTPREGHSVLVYGGKMWLIGGGYYTDNYWHTVGDVWSSADGVTWTLVTAAGPWNAVMYPATAVFNDKMWVFGGGIILWSWTCSNAVWSSTDGVNWEQAGTPPWSGRIQHQVVAAAGQVWLMGGNDGTGTHFENDTWRWDGSTWTLAEANGPWSARGAHTAVAHDNALWLAGGYDVNLTYTNDVWRYALPPVAK